jgi:peptidoglycan/LPS O-acetylase OafA/YrhL
MFNEQFRLKSTAAGLTHWWIIIIAVAVSGTKVWHLFWLMPLTMAVCVFVFTAMLASNPNTTRVFSASSWIVWPATWVAYKLSN